MSTSCCVKWLTRILWSLHARMTRIPIKGHESMATYHASIRLVTERIRECSSKLFFIYKLLHCNCMCPLFTPSTECPTIHLNKVVLQFDHIAYYVSVVIVIVVKCCHYVIVDRKYWTPGQIEFPVLWKPSAKLRRASYQYRNAQIISKKYNYCKYLSCVHILLQKIIMCAYWKLIA